jgi:hypothetical protein
MAADSASALCMLALIWLFQSGQVQLWHVYALMAVRSSMQAFQQPALTASAAMLVPAEWIGKAAGLNQALGGIITIAAPALGALSLAALSFHGALMIDVVTALLAVALLLPFRIPQPQEHRMWVLINAMGSTERRPPSALPPTTSRFGLVRRALFGAGARPHPMGRAQARGRRTPAPRDQRAGAPLARCFAAAAQSAGRGSASV